MFDVKAIMSIVAVVLTFVGYVPYIRDTLSGTTKPHVFSWFIWGLMTFVIYALQVSAGAGSGAWVTLTLAVLLLFVFFLSLKNGSKHIKKIDTVSLLFALLALFLWLIVKQSVFSIILLVTTDMLGFIPTIRKSWNEPYSETLSFYIITTFRHGLSFLALAEYNIITWLFPVTWIFANALFATLLIVRRKCIKIEV